jgi:hypothetical protein
MLLFSFTGCEQPDDDGDDEVSIEIGRGKTGANTVKEPMIITPSESVVKVGGEQTFHAADKENNTVKGVVWSVSGNNIGDSEITSGGWLTVGQNASGKITVTANATGKTTETAAVTILSSPPDDISASPPISWGLSLFPSSVSLPRDREVVQTFVALANGEAAASVNWDIMSGTSNTSIENGKLTIGKDETAERIVVRARLGDDFATAVVKIPGNGGSSTGNGEAAGEGEGSESTDEGGEDTGESEGEGRGNGEDEGPEGDGGEGTEGEDSTNENEGNSDSDGKDNNDREDTGGSDGEGGGTGEDESTGSDGGEGTEGGENTDENESNGDNDVDNVPPPESYSVTIVPPTETSITKGNRYLFSATYNAPSADITVEWKVNSSVSIIESNADGTALLTIAESETSQKLTITASIQLKLNKYEDSVEISVLPKLPNLDSWKELSNNNIKSIAYGIVDERGIFVAVNGNNNELLLSSDGESWKTVVPTWNTVPTNREPINRVRFLNDRFFAVGNAIIGTSSNGTDWEFINYTAPHPYVGYNFRDIISIPEGFIIVGEESASKGFIIYATDIIASSKWQDDLWVKAKGNNPPPIVSVVSGLDENKFIIVENNTGMCYECSYSSSIPLSLSVQIIGSTHIGERVNDIRVNDILVVHNSFFAIADDGKLYKGLYDDNPKRLTWKSESYNLSGISPGFIASMIYIENDNKFIATTSEGKVISTSTTR